MTWDPKLRKAPRRAKEPWLSQEQEWDAWMKRIAQRGKPNTQRNLEMYTRPLFRMFHPELVTSLSDDDMRNFIAAMEPKCSRLVNSDPPSCRKRLDIATCPMLTGAPVESCSGYRRLRVTGVLPYVHSVNQMYEWFREQQRLPEGNPMLQVMGDYKDKHKAHLNELANDPDRRDLTLEEIVTLIRGSSPGHAVVYFMAPKFFLRIHEALRMSFDPKYYNPIEGYMIIPAGLPGEPHKRQGNHVVIMDREAINYLEAYRTSYWLPNVRRDKDGQPVTQRIALTMYGKAFEGERAEGNFNKQALRKDAIRLGLMTGKEEKGEAITTHAFRAFACTYARNRKCPQVDEWVMRGDKITGPAGRYDNYRPRLAQLYRDYAPVLGI